jgi:hypothetical protein
MLLEAMLILLTAVHPAEVGGDPRTEIRTGLLPSAGGTGEPVLNGSRSELDIPAPMVPEAEVRIDGLMDEAAWARAAVLTGFTQYDPIEGIPASQETEVRLLLTGEALLLGVRAYDSDKDGVRATLTERDGYGRSDDYVRFLLDTFDDQRRAFVFQVNPLGVQGDGIWVEGAGGRGDPIDWNPDFLWESAGRVDHGGYTAELRIPLESLRFPDAAVQDWGFQVVRRIQRTGYEASWAPLRRETANKLAQSGRLRSLRGLRPGRFMEVNPVVTASRQGQWDAQEDLFRRRGATGDFGFNLAYGITSNLTLDATYNPDFSQVESDAGQITVNERFAMFLPEKRSFFLEGTDVFSMPRQLVYTRSIVSPVGAAKLSGKVGATSLAYLGAVDGVAGQAGSPVVNLFRVKRDVGGSSSVGAVYTDRTVSGDHYNRVFGMDGRFVLARRYTLDVMAAGSADASPGTETDWGTLFLARFSRAGRNLSVSASFEDVTEDFQARSGFIRRVGTTQGEARVGYTWRGKEGAVVESWGPSVEVQGYWERDAFWAGAGPQEAEVQLNLSGSFRNNIGGRLSYSRSLFSFSPLAYQGLYLGGGAEAGTDAFSPGAGLFSGLDAVRLRGWLSSWERARVSMGGSWSETPIFDPTGVPADLAESWSGDLNLTLYPSGSLQAAVGLRHVSLFRQRDGSRYSSATIPRIQARYQFTRALFVRGVGEYASQTRGEIRDPDTGRTLLSCEEECSARSGSERFDFRLEGLVGYEPSPGTVFFLGYSRQMRDTRSFGLRDLTTRADGLFLKVSYRFRM